MGRNRARLWLNTPTHGTTTRHVHRICLQGLYDSIGHHVHVTLHASTCRTLQRSVIMRQDTPIAPMACPVLLKLQCCSGAVLNCSLNGKNKMSETSGRSTDQSKRNLSHSLACARKHANCQLIPAWLGIGASPIVPKSTKSNVLNGLAMSSL